MRRISLLPILTCTLLGMQVVPASGGANDPLPADTVLEIRGRGWGHGRGMGQWGSKGMADAGKTHTEILDHYYTGVAHGDRGNPSIRVLVEASPDVIVTSNKSFKVKFSDSKLLQEVPAGTFFRINYTGSKYRYATSNRWDGGWTTVTTDNRYGKFIKGDALLELVRSGGSVRRYRGSIIARYAATDGMRAINSLPMEDYLKGVVPRESPSSWPADALEAQSVAARTYAYRYRDVSRDRGNTFDICATTSCQVYEGHSARSTPGGSITSHEATSTNNAIANTAGEVLTYGGDPILAEFSSSTGGYTAPGSVPYQQPVPDPSDSVSPHHSWTASIPVTAIESRWPSIGRLIRIDITERNGYGEWGGRVKRLELIGTKNNVGMSGDSFRSAFAWPSSGDVRSSWFTIGLIKADRVSVPSSTTLVEGTTKTLLYRFRNTGTDPWFVGGDLTLSTTSASPLEHPSWETATRITRIHRNVTRPSASLVQPDEVAEFRLTIDGRSASPGQVNLPIRLVPIDGSVVDSSTLKVTIVESWLERAPSLLTSSSFEKGWKGWERETRSGDKLGDGRDRSRGVVLRDAGRRRIEQTIAFTGGTSRRFVLGAWAKLKNADLTASAILRYEGGSTRSAKLSGWAEDGKWRYRERGFRTWDTRGLRSLTVRFDANLGKGGRLSLDAVRLVEDRISNPSFEELPTAPAGEDLPGGWEVTGVTGTSPPKTAGWTAWDGSNSLLIPGRPEPTVVEQRLRLDALAWETLTLRFAERAYDADALAPGWKVSLILEHPDGSETKQSYELSTGPHPWRSERIAVRLKKAAPFARIRIEQAGQTGKAYFDAFRLLRSRLQDPSFEDLDSWGTAALGAGDGLKTSAARDGSRGLRLGGTERAYTSQRFVMRGSPARKLRVSAFDVVSGSLVRQSRVEIAVTFFHKDGSKNVRRLQLADRTHPWRWNEWIVASTERYEEIRVTVSTRGHPGSAFVDQLLVTEA